MAIYKRGRRFELGTTENKSSKRADHSATLPPYFFSLNTAKLLVFAQNIGKNNIFLGILFI